MPQAETDSLRTDSLRTDSLRTDSLRIQYQVAGEAGSPVVLIMGLGLPAAGWAAQVEAFAPHHRVLTFDNRGVGGTGSPPGPYRIEEMAGDTLALMDHLGWPDAHVAGISMGGMIAQELALSAPGRVRSLALLSTAGRGLGWKPSLYGLQAGLMVIFGRGESRLHALLKQLLSEEALERVDRGEATRKMADRLGPLPPPRTFLAQYAAVLCFRSEERLGELDGLPTLVIQPGRDRVIHPGESERLAGRIPGATLVCFPRSGHGVIVEQEAAVNRLLLAHFRRVDATQAQEG